MEGLLTYLLERRGAARTVAYDRSLALRGKGSNGARFRLAHEVLGSRSQFIYDVPLRTLHEETGELGLPQFDLVVFSGVLYHMLDPLAGLTQLRQLTRTGGVALIETAAVLSPEAAMFANVRGRFYSADDYWFISVEALEYWLRFFHFQPLACTHVLHHQSEGHQVIRVAVICRAIPGYLASESDSWMKKQDDKLFVTDFAEFFRPDFSALPPRQEPVEFDWKPESMVWRDQSRGVLDLYSSLMASKPLSLEGNENLVRLSLQDQ
jgi:SAM-dependent methyltransferase